MNSLPILWFLSFEKGVTQGMRNGVDISLGLRPEYFYYIYNVSLIY